jgi:hypothetical protein
MRRLGFVTLTAVVTAALTGCSTANVVSRPASSGAPQVTGGAVSTSPSPPAGKPFSLYTHCGFVNTEYAGRFWVADTPAPTLTVRGDETGLVTMDGYTDGTMTMVGDDLLRFTIDDPFIEEQGLFVDFVPGSEPTSRCE